MTTDARAEDTVRPRDADGTRLRLLRSARVRFARDGYSGTTVRDIAADAGVNVSLINRYFSSKDGLFEACLRRAVADLDPPTGERRTLGLVVEQIVDQLSDPRDGEVSLQLLLLLRSSGDERADAVRRATLQSYAEGLAGVAGWSSASPDDADDLLLRAQVVLSTALGIVLLRSSVGLEPLTSAGADALTRPVGDVVAALLGSVGGRQA